MSQVICLLVAILFLPAQAIAQDSVSTRSEPAPGSKVVDDAQEALKRLEAEMERLSQQEARKSRPLDEVVEQMERQRKEDETRRLQRLRELKRQLDRSMVDSNVSRFHNEHKRSKYNFRRLFLVIGATLCGLWFIALIVGRIINGKRVDTAALRTELHNAEDVESIAEKVLTAIPLLERQMEYSQAVSLLTELASRLEENSEHTKYVANEIARLNNLDKAGGSAVTRPQNERSSTIGG